MICVYIDYKIFKDCPKLYYVFKFMTQSINVWVLYVFVVLALVSFICKRHLFWNIMGLISLSGVNKVQFHLGVLDLDLTLLIDKLVAINYLSNIEQRSFHKAWKKSNKLSLMFMHVIVATWHKKFMEEWSQSNFVDESSTGTLMGTLTTMNFMVHVLSMSMSPR